MSNQVTRRDFLKIAAAAAGAAAYLSACGPVGKEGAPTAAETAAGTPTPLYIPSPINSLIPIPNPDLTPTVFLTPTATPTLAEADLVAAEHQAVADDIAGLGETYKTRYPAWRNRLVDETSGISVVSLKRLGQYFTARADASLNSILLYDRMFDGLYLPVKDFSDRAPDFDRRNDGQGLGFAKDDLNYLVSAETGVLQIQSAIKISRENNGFHRAWLLGRADQTDAMVLATVDNFMLVNGLNPLESGNLRYRKDLFFQMIGSLGIINYVQGYYWWQITASGRFDIACSTFTAEAYSRSRQPERIRLLSYYPNLDAGTSGVEGEEETVVDARSSVLIAGVSPVGDKALRIEGYTLANLPDTTNSQQNYPNNLACSAAGYRWLPCGAGIPSAAGQPEAVGTQPAATPVKSGPPVHNPNGDPSGGEPPAGGSNDSGSNSVVTDNVPEE